MLASARACSIGLVVGREVVVVCGAEEAAALVVEDVVVDTATLVVW